MAPVSPPVGAQLRAESSVPPPVGETDDSLVGMVLLPVVPLAFGMRSVVAVA